MEQNKEYYAFISYKREDEKWAKWLQHRLEHYKLPSNLNGRTDLPREIRPIFRDTSELNPGNLPQQIYNALSASRHLIVICSPYSAQSEWVNKEVETFIAMGKQDCIIPFIIDGRPYADTPTEECFPPAIRSIPKEQEILGANITEMGRDAAAVKTVAQMFGVRFDTLWKRYEREQKKKRMTFIILGLIFSFFLLSIAIVIGKQNVEIRRSNWSMMENRARFLSQEIQKMIDDGDCYTACRLLLFILPENLSDPDKPYSEQLEFLFRTALSNNNAKIESDWVGLATFSPNGILIAENGAYEATIIWNALNGAKQQELGRYYCGDDNSDRAVSIMFSNDSKSVLTIHQKKDCSIWNVLTGKEETHYSSYEDVPSDILSSYSNIYKTIDTVYNYPKKCQNSPDKKRVLINENGILIVKNIQSDNLKRTIFSKGTRNMRWSYDYKYIIGSDNDAYYIWNYLTGKTERIIPGAMDVIYSEKSIFALFCNGPRFKVVDCVQGKTISEFLLPNDCNIDDYYSFFDPIGEKVIVETELFEALFYDVQSGRLIKRMEVPSEGGFRGVVSTDGRFYAVSGTLEPNSLFDVQSYSLLNTFSGGSGDYIAISDNGSRIAFARRDDGIVSYSIHGDSVTHVFFSNLSENANSISFSHDGALLVSTHDDGIVRVWNATSGSLLNELKGHKGKSVGAIFSSNNREIVSSDEKGNVKVWEFLPLQELMDRTRKRFQANPLTPEERRRFYLE